jgi:hypothetical protein
MVRASILVVLVGSACAQSEERPWPVTLALSRATLDQGRSRAAEDLAATALRQAAGASTDDLAAIRLVLAEACLRQGAYGRAERWVWQAQEPLERAHGTDHPEVALCLYLRAEIFRRLGFTDLAEPLAVQALAIRRKTRGDEHPEIADSLEQLGWLWAGGRSSGRGELYPGVLAGSWQTTFPTALALRRRVQGNYHPDTLAAEIQRLAGSGSIATCREEGRRYLARIIKKYGPHHPLVPRCLLMMSYNPFPLDGSWDASLVEAEQYVVDALSRLREHPSPDPMDVSAALRRLASLRDHQGQLAQAESLRAEAIVRNLAQLNDVDLCRFFRQIVPIPRNVHPDNSHLTEMFLTEMVRRGGPVIEACLEDAHRQRYGAYVRAQVASAFTEPTADLLAPFGIRPRPLESRLENLELLTALRRVQGKPDPLRIVVKAPPRIECEFPDLPQLQVGLRNVDVERLDLDYLIGGDILNGRQERWRFVVHDDRGNLLPNRGVLCNEDGTVSGGGVDFAPRWHYGQSWETELSLRSYLELQRPGTYQLRLAFHDRLSIATAEGNLAGRIVCWSDPLELIVKRRSIVLQPGDCATVRRLLGELDEKAPVQIVADSQAPAAQRFLRPETPAGRLLELGWRAVPALLTELTREDLDTKRRAWVLALLFSITGYHDPRQASDVLGDRLSRDPAYYWSDQRLCGSWNDTRFRAGQVNAEKQRTFAKRWLEFEKNLEVNEPQFPGIPSKEPPP